jgi:ribitol 2-dehydrogenase
MGEMSMSGLLEGKVAAVTGAASGIGLACAKRLHAEGATVVFVDRDAAKLAEITAELGDRAKALQIDLLDKQQVNGLLDGILGVAGELDIFHANAGAYVGGPIAEGDPDQWDFVLNLNVNASFRAVRSVLPHLVAKGSGDVVMTSSIAGFVPVIWEPVYTASKFAVTSFVQSLRRQVGPQGVRVGNVAPVRWRPPSSPTGPKRSSSTRARRERSCAPRMSPRRSRSW